MASAKRVAVVTGANKGIGFAIVRGLCKQFDGDVYLTARSEMNGQEAVKKLNEEGLTPKFHPMDINDTASRDRLRAFLQNTYGGVDVMVNNAGIGYKVTGANKGIGFAIVRGLCKQFDGDVYLTARNESSGQEAIKKLNEEGLKPKFHQMDLTDTESIDRLKTFLQNSYGGIDILVNNAGVAPKQASSATEPFSEQAEVTVATNFWGTLNVCKRLFPLLRPHSRVVNVSSMMSNMTGKVCSDALKARFLAPDLTMAQVEELMTEFVTSAKEGNFEKKGWPPESAYGSSKIGVTLMTFVQQKEMNADSREDIVANACCPGWVNTDMVGNTGPKTIDEGADTPLYLAMLPPNIKEPKGQMVSNRKANPWPDHMDVLA